jgi:hypothetical protein
LLPHILGKKKRAFLPAVCTAGHFLPPGKNCGSVAPAYLSTNMGSISPGCLHCGSLGPPGKIAGQLLLQRHTKGAFSWRFGLRVTSLPGKNWVHCSRRFKRTGCT